jgi:quercetin dioxygenase-like cupin family protein
MQIATRISNITHQGIDINTYQADVGEGIPMHTHTFSHSTVCQSGSCKVIVGDKVFFLVNNTFYEMPAGVPHEIEALEDGTTIVNILPSQIIQAYA